MVCNEVFCMDLSQHGTAFDGVLRLDEVCCDFSFASSLKIGPRLVLRFLANPLYDLRGLAGRLASLTAPCSDLAPYPARADKGEAQALKADA